MLAGVADPSTPWRCERIGDELLEGRGVVVYRAVSSPGRDILGWIDPSLKFPLRVRMQDGTSITARDIHEKPQPSHLFEIPSGLRTSSTVDEHLWLFPATSQAYRSGEHSPACHEDSLGNPEPLREGEGLEFGRSETMSTGVENPLPPGEGRVRGWT